MRKKLILLLMLTLFAVCLLAIGVGATPICAEGEHTGEWTVDTTDGVLKQAYSQCVCSVCGLVLEEESIAPLVDSKGFSYYDGSMVQGFYVDTSALDKYISRTGKAISYGVVAASIELGGNNPLGADVELTNEGVVAVELSNKKTTHFEIKVTGVPNDSIDVKLALCAYIVIDGEIMYIDNGSVDNSVAGVSYSDVVNLLENGVQPAGLYTHRMLSLDELDLHCQAYWNTTTKTTMIMGDSTSKTFFATRAFTEDELPAGSYIVIKQGWSVRPELIREDLKANKERPYSSPLKANGSTYSIDEMWAKDENSEVKFKYLAFNITTSSTMRGYADKYTEEAIADVFEIYVPVNTEVVKRENAPEAAKEISTVGLQLLTKEQLDFKINSYWNSTSSTTRTPSSTGGDGKYYFATRSFTEAELPVGTVIEIAEGWQQRTEYWIDGAKNSVRPSSATTFRIKITEADCHGDSKVTRAFNICTLYWDTVDADDMDAFLDAFKIYVPSTSTLYNAAATQE